MPLVESLKRRLLSAAPLCLCVTLAACGDSDPASPGEGSEFDPQAVQESLEAVYASLDDDSDVLIGLDLAADALGGSTAAVLAGGDLARPRLSPSAKASRALLSSSAAGEVIPPELLGTIFVWNPETDAYEVDETLTGAPADGVRFILYAVDPITRRPVEPLIEVGHLDLIDESDPASVRLVVRAAIGETTLVDYFVAGTVTTSASGFTVTAAAVGFVSDGTHRVDFDFSQTGEFDETSQTASFGVDYSLEGSPGDVSLALGGSVLINTETGELVSAEFSLTIVYGGNTLLLTLEATTVGVSGAFTHNGQVAVSVSGTLEEPTFTRADGAELAAEDIQALEGLSDLLDEIVGFAERLLEPLSELGAL